MDWIIKTYHFIPINNPIRNKKNLNFFNKFLFLGGLKFHKLKQNYRKSRCPPVINPRKNNENKTKQNHRSFPTKNMKHTHDDLSALRFIRNFSSLPGCLNRDSFILFTFYYKELLNLCTYINLWRTFHTLSHTPVTLWP